MNLIKSEKCYKISDEKVINQKSISEGLRKETNMNVDTGLKKKIFELFLSDTETRNQAEYSRLVYSPRLLVMSEISCFDLKASAQLRSASELEEK